MPRRGSIAAVEVKPQVVSPTSVPSGHALLRCLASARFAAMLCIWGETPKNHNCRKIGSGRVGTSLDVPESNLSLENDQIFFKDGFLAATYNISFAKSLEIISD